jgi:hypothetical protein
MKTSSIQSPSASQNPMDEPHIETTAFAWKPLYKVGGMAALVQIAIIVIQAPIFILYPQPTTVLGHFTQFQSNRLLGLLDLDLMLILGEAFSVLIVLALYVALKRASPSLMAIALTLGLGGIALFFAVNPTLSMLYLSDQYAAATTDAQRAAFLAAGEALWANYNGTAFGLFFVFSGVAYVIIAAVMLRSGVFNKTTASVGILMGVMMLVPPLPPVGTIGLVLSYIVIVPSAIWNILIARRLFQLGQGVSKEEAKQPALVISE